MTHGQNRAGRLPVQLLLAPLLVSPVRLAQAAQEEARLNGDLHGGQSSSGSVAEPLDS